MTASPGAPAAATVLPARLTTRAGEVLLRRAGVADVPAVVALIADDQLGAARDGLVSNSARDGAARDGDARDGDARDGDARDGDDVEALRPYLRAFATIDADPAHLLLVGELDGVVVATSQLSVLPGLARRGALRAQVEAVRVAASHRSSGVGAAMVGWLVQEARRRGCAVVQLTTDKRRLDAHRFYQRLGFVASHEGMKLPLGASGADGTCAREEPPTPSESAAPRATGGQPV